MDLDEANDKQNLTFSRRYLDPNRVSYEVGLPEMCGAHSIHI